MKKYINILLLLLFVLISLSACATDPLSAESTTLPSSFVESTDMISATETAIEPETEATTAPITEHIHNFMDATCTEPQTCSCGATEGDANGHFWEIATCTAPATCSVCGETDGTPTEHNYSNGKCTNCDQVDPNYQSEPLVWIPQNITRIQVAVI